MTDFMGKAYIGSYCQCYCTWRWGTACEYGKIKYKKQYSYEIWDLFITVQSDFSVIKRLSLFLISLFDYVN